MKVLIDDMTATSLEMSVSSHGKTGYNGADGSGMFYFKCNDLLYTQRILKKAV